jgi:hypothetical protein
MYWKIRVLPAPVLAPGLMGLGEKLFLAPARTGVVARDTSGTPRASMTGAAPSSTTLTPPTNPSTEPASFSVSARLVAAWKRSSACTRLSFRPHTPPWLLTMLK